MKKRRRKLREEITSNIVTPPIEQRQVISDPLLVKILRPALMCLLEVEHLKNEYFHPERLLKNYFRKNQCDLFAQHMEEYLEKSLSYTYKKIGEVNETVLQWILLDTPISLFVFSLVRDNYEKYLKQQ
ncbi:MAG TPA: hypothetical protein VNW06_04625 [Cytophagaceae bacterium]|jgi:hypothetical protein|nr:hypothetical protein [Cytophagaceae bacterium]